MISAPSPRPRGQAPAAPEAEDSEGLGCTFWELSMRKVCAKYARSDETDGGWFCRLWVPLPGLFCLCLFWARIDGGVCF